VIWQDIGNVAGASSSSFVTEIIYEKFRINRGKIKLKNRLFDDFYTHLVGILFHVFGYPFNSPSYIFSRWCHGRHENFSLLLNIREISAPYRWKFNHIFPG